MDESSRQIGGCPDKKIPHFIYKKKIDMTSKLAY
jgi:hypothetical protein